MSNNRRGIMKFAADGLEKFAPITTSVPGTGGVPYETIQSLTNVVQMDLFDSQRALVLTQAGDLRTVALP